VPTKKVPTKSLRQLYEVHQGKVSDKWALYLQEYDALLNPYRQAPVRLLEIGIQNGGSLDIWCEYFPQAQKIVGCDIDPKCAALTYADPRVAVVVADANTDAAEQAILNHAGAFDVVIDDGSHTSGDIVKSFARYFAKVVDGGVYIIEDLHCSYWQEFAGGLFDPYSSLSFFKLLVDVINHEHWGVDRSRSDLLQGFAQTYGVTFDEEVLQQLHSVEMFNSTCVIHKLPAAANSLGARLVVGDEALVYPGLAGFANHVEVLPQAQNAWSTRARPPAEELPQRLEELAAQQQALAALEQLKISNETEIAIRDATLVDRQNQIAVRDATIVDRQNQLASRDAELADRDQQLAKQNAQLRALRQQIGVANADNKRLEHDLSAASEQAVQKAASISNLTQWVDLLHRDIDMIHQTTSWRLTRPLRMVKDWFTPQAFDPNYYLQRNPDVADSGVDPHTHYVTHGRAEGRLSRASVGVGGGARQKFRARLVRTFRALNRRSRAALPSAIKDLLREPLATTHNGRNDYAEWIRRYDTLEDADRVAMVEQIAEMVNPPLISILMPTYNSNLVWLEEAVDSVRLQCYPHWELCIADDASTDSEVQQFLQALQETDKRIKVTFCERNGHISRSSNAALKLCSGEWVALMDHDDKLAEHALYCVARALEKQPDIALIYSDEDKLDEQGRRKEPYFKCDWNPDLFYSHNMVSHLGVYRRDLLNSIGGFREGFEGSQDYDLCLRYIEKIDQAAIHHIPRVLYHWRVHPQSTAHSLASKPYAAIAGQTALQEHFDRLGVDARVGWEPAGYRVQYSLPASQPLVSLIIPTRNGLALLKQCIDSIMAKTSYRQFEILVVDNASDDPEILAYFASLGRLPNVRVLRDESPFNFSALNNRAAAVASGEYIGLVNNDIEVIADDWLGELLSIAQQPGVGVVGAKLLYPDNNLQHAGVVLGLGGVAGHAFRMQGRHADGYFGRAKVISGYSAVTAACVLVKKSIYMEVSGLDEAHLAVAFNDVDFCLRVREAGYRNVWTPHALLYHHESASRGLEDTAEKQARFESEVHYMHERWGEQLQADPAYSPNLTLAHMDFSLAWPPRVPS